MSLVMIFLALTFVLVIPNESRAGTLFEGYFKVLLGTNHIGYFIIRYESLPEKKQMKANYFIYVSVNNQNTTEGLTALADENFVPINYQYSALMNGKIKSIDATIVKNKMTVKLTEGGIPKTFKTDLQENSFLSIFLNYVILKNGLAKGKSYAYEAVAEEEGQPYKGTALVKEPQKVGNIEAYNLDFNFKNTQFSSLMSIKGESLGTVQESIRTELVKTRAEAVGKILFPEKTVRTLFGNIPEGTKNPLYAAEATVPSASSANPTPVPLSTSPSNEKTTKSE